MLELSIFTPCNESVKFAVPSVIKFEARSSKHYFNCGQPVVGYTGASRYHFFLRTCRTWMEDIARCFYASRHSIHARWIKVKWDFLFGNCIAIGVQFVARKMEKKYQFVSFLFFFAFKKSFFSRWDFYFSRFSRENATFSLKYILCIFPTLLNIHGTLHWNSTSEWWASRYVIGDNAKLQEEERRVTIYIIYKAPRYLFHVKIMLKSYASLFKKYVGYANFLYRFDIHIVSQRDWILSTLNIIESSIIIAFINFSYRYITLINYIL